MRRTTLSIAVAAVVAAALGAAPAVASGGPIGFVKHPERAVKVAGKNRATALSPAALLTRIAGANRYTTAVAVSVATFPDGTWGAPDNAPVEYVFVANAMNFPDALATGPAAYAVGPILLVPATGTVPAAVVAEVKRLNDANIAHGGTGLTIIPVGGTDVVSDAVVAQLPSGHPAQRTAGANRFETAALIAEENNQAWINLPPAQGGDGTGVASVFVANGLGFADSLAGGGAAAGFPHGGSLVLTSPTSLPASTAAALTSINPPNVFILGGTDVVSAGVLNAIKTLLPSATVERLEGPNRYETAVAISQRTSFTGNDIIMVNGLNFPDALSAAPLAGLYGMTTLLTSGKCVTAGTAQEANIIGPSQITAVGGTDVVSENARNLGVC